ncbi:MAG: LacI family DNA-binding transcriptional regulator [Clostridium sp.]|uniref:LacI family DNA-binding transcriptional regulator n=1 Tax=Clostridium sp. TaxID=1506 RepID=UPI001EC797D7|nr:LacI family DNA-binding transcriptional regulator [Clostridium sp.]MBS5885313.1 LacI family DNA-binding transcriptional regulator [Clostridium sp.]MDU7149170.1 LacI family DNA-binding transcriptional regulator [Clostridium sp.]
MKNKKATIKDVAKEANVSIATVSYVVNNVDKVIPETKDRVLEAIKKLGYIPNTTARNLVKKESRVIGLLMPTKSGLDKTILMDNPFYQEFFSGVEFKARDYGYSTEIIAYEDEQEFINNINGNIFAGIIVLGLIKDNIYDSLVALNTPVVIIDQDRKVDKFYHINTDDELGAYIAVKHLIEKGHKSIGLLTQNINDSIVHLKRYMGYKRALEESSIKINEELIFIGEVTYEGGENAAEIVASKLNKITAVFSISDIMAMGLIKGLFKRKIYVPRDLSIVGFDDIKYSKYFIPELTTIRQDIFYKGEKSVYIIFNVNRGKKVEKDTIIQVKLIERESIYELDK